MSWQQPLSTCECRVPATSAYRGRARRDTLLVRELVADVAKPLDRWPTDCGYDHQYSNDGGYMMKCYFLVY